MDSVNGNAGNAGGVEPSEAVLGAQLGFVIRMHHSNPYLYWLDGNGALSRHGRGATEAEVRMWHLLLGQPYEAWSAGIMPSATRDALDRMGVGRPVALRPRGEAGR